MLPLLALLVAGSVADREVYDTFELTVPAAPAAGANPFAVAPAAEFRHDAGEVVRVAGFCDAADGRVYRVRFMPTKPGRWAYAVTPPTGPRVEGAFTAAAAGRKGPVRVDPKHPHHFVWEGTGEHVFLNGTTTYWLLGVQDEARIAAAVDRLAAHRINRIRVAVNARTTGGDRWFEPAVQNSAGFRFRIDPWPNANPADPKQPAFDLARFDLPLWQKLDRLVRHARDRDVLVSVVFHLDGADPGVDPFGGGKAGIPSYTGSEAEWAYYRYAAARLGAFSNVMWDLSNEWHLFRGERWVDAAGAVLRAADPYRHLTSVHGRADYPFYKSPWSDFALYQSWDQSGAYAFLRKRRELGDKVRPMPHVNEEYGYEDHYPTWGKTKPPARSAANRAGLAWEMGFAGGYQTTGERADVPGQGGWITGLGDDTMKLPVLHRHLADFFTAFDWWACDPADGLADAGARVLADPDRKTVAVYLPRGERCTVKLPPGGYAVRWYDPRAGRWGQPAAAAGDWAATPPGAGDWAVLLRRR